MNDNRIGRPKSLLLLGPAALLGAGAAAGLWLWQANGGGGPVLPALAGFVLAAALAVFLFFRVRAARRWQAVLDAYATREITLEAVQKNVPHQAFGRRKRRAKGRSSDAGSHAKTG